MVRFEVTVGRLPRFRGKLELGTPLSDAVTRAVPITEPLPDSDSVIGTTIIPFVRVGTPGTMVIWGLPLAALFTRVVRLLSMVERTTGSLSIVE